MPSNLKRYRDDLARLVDTGKVMWADLSVRRLPPSKRLPRDAAKMGKKIHGLFEDAYQCWYTESCAVLRQILPDRLAEFQELYSGNPKRKGVDLTTYSINDWLRGIRSVEDPYTGKKSFNDLACVGTRFDTQFEILKAAKVRFESSLFEIRQLLQADLFDREIDAARELLSHGFTRAAGAVAGVVLESHLGAVCSSHGISIRKKHPGINDLNEILKARQILDVPTWRFIQRLADLRNLADHDRKREPTEEEVQELIDGTDKITKTVS
jgi:uncharacterized protein (UPF0332 family)